MQSGQHTQSDIPTGRPAGDLARNRLHDYLIGLARLQVLELPSVLVVPVSRDRREPPITTERNLILVELGSSIGRIPKHTEGSRRYGRFVEGHIEGTQRYCTILSCGRRGRLVFRNSLHGNVIRSTCNMKTI